MVILCVHTKLYGKSIGFAQRSIEYKSETVYSENHQLLENPQSVHTKQTNKHPKIKSKCSSWYVFETDQILFCCDEVLYFCITLQVPPSCRKKTSKMGFCPLDKDRKKYTQCSVDTGLCAESCSVNENQHPSNENITFFR